MGTHTIQASVTVANGVLTATIGPVQVDVPNIAAETEGQTLQWVITGDEATVFNPTDYLVWNAPNSPLTPPTVSRSSDGKTLTASYENTVEGSAPVQWAYTVNMLHGTQRVRIDPEVDNLPPNP